MLISSEELPSTAEPFREVGVQIHHDFPAQAVRTTEESNHQIDRLAVWRA
jgi:hypothetical protein